VALTVREIETAAPKDKRYLLYDGDGLALEVMTSGKKYWRFRDQRGAHEVKLTLGPYPVLSLLEARMKRVELQKAQLEGHTLHEIKSPKNLPAKVTFGDIAREWFRKKSPGWRASHAKKTLSRLERYLIAAWEDHPIAEIRRKDLLDVLKPLEDAGQMDNVRKIRIITGQVFRYGMGLEVCESDISVGVRELLKSPGEVRHYPALTKPEDIVGLLRSIDGYKGSFVVKTALLFHLHVFLRPGEVRKLKWDDINFEKREICITGDNMKMGQEHRIPMSRKVIEILESIKPLTGRGIYIFPNERNLIKADRPMSENAENGALRRLGYSKDEIVAHGLRATASTILNEARNSDGSRKWSSDAIERQMAHSERNKSRAPYDRGERWAERTEMMEWWSDWLDNLIEEYE
jgi:integrase